MVLVLIGKLLPFTLSVVEHGNAVVVAFTALFGVINDEFSDVDAAREMISTLFDGFTGTDVSVVDEFNAALYDVIGGVCATH